MVAYYETDTALDAALNKAKTPDDVIKIIHDLEQRLAPNHWIRKAVSVFRSM